MQAAFTVRSSGRDLFVQFKSDESTGRPGFHAVYGFETLNGTVDDAGRSLDEDIIVVLDAEDGTEYTDVELYQPKVKGDPSAEKHLQAGLYEVERSGRPT